MCTVFADPTVGVDVILGWHSCFTTGSVERSNQSVEATLQTLRRLQREDGGNGVGFVQHLARIMLTNNNGS